jgi:hypothetical protein
MTNCAICRAEGRLVAADPRADEPMPLCPSYRVQNLWDTKTGRWPDLPLLTPANEWSAEPLAAYNRLTRPFLL